MIVLIAPNRRTVGCTVRFDFPRLRTVTFAVGAELAGAVFSILRGKTKALFPTWCPGRPMDRASCTARRALTRPAPSSLAGTPSSVALLVMMVFTIDGDGVRFPWVLRYAWMTSATTPAV